MRIMNADRKSRVLAFAAGMIPVTWLALKFAPYAEGGLFAALTEFDEIFASPLRIQRIT